MYQGTLNKLKQAQDDAYRASSILAQVLDFNKHNPNLSLRENIRVRRAWAQILGAGQVLSEVCVDVTIMQIDPP